MVYLGSKRKNIITHSKSRYGNIDMVKESFTLMGGIHNGKDLMHPV